MKQGLYVQVDDAIRIASNYIKQEDAPNFANALKDAATMFVTESGNLIRKKDS